MRTRFNLLKVFLGPVCSCLLLLGCSSVTVPQVSSVAPCQIQTNIQMEQAILSALSEKNWDVLSFSPHWIKARKRSGSMLVVVDIAYGYRGFSIEYDYSDGMGYDPETDTIDRLYVKWLNNLANEVKKVLNREIDLSPPVECSKKLLSTK